MIKHVLFCGTLACAMVCQAAPQSRVGKLFGARKQRTEMRVPASTVTKWLPGKVDAYYWGPEWCLNDGESHVYTYDQRGNMLTSVNAYGKTVYEYNSDNMPVSEMSYTLGENGEEKLFRQSKFEYDKVVKGFKILEEYTTYYDESNPERKSIRRDVERNSAGNVISLSEYYFNSSANMSEPVLQGRITVSYGADGKANELKTYVRDEVDITPDSGIGYSRSDEEDLGLDMWLTDLVWENTNGQFVSEDIESVDLEDVLVGDNRLKSAVMRAEYSDLEMILKAKYYGRDFRAEMTCQGIALSSGTHKFTDSYGSYEEYFSGVEVGMTPEGTLFEDGKTDNVFIVTYDRFGLLLREYEYEKDDEGYEWFEEHKGKVAYDPTHGYPVEYIVSYGGTDHGEGYTEMSRKVFSNYTSVEVDGIETVGAVDGNAPVEYFDLQGKRVANPAGGLFILRQGGRATKVVL